MGAKLYLILGLGCVSLATSLAASAKLAVDKEAEVAKRLDKRTKQSLQNKNSEMQNDYVFQIFRFLMLFSFPTLRAPVPVREGEYGGVRVRAFVTYCTNINNNL